MSLLCNPSITSIQLLKFSFFIICSAAIKFIKWTFKCYAHSYSTLFVSETIKFWANSWIGFVRLKYFTRHYVQFSSYIQKFWNFYLLLDLSYLRQTFRPSLSFLAGTSFSTADTAISFLWRSCHLIYILPHFNIVVSTRQPHVTVLSTLADLGQEGKILVWLTH
jgi:hypothetical protein